ncbi:DUF4283 domain-containing protein/zf-CCHC_4 domain-containing protein [Cephalotus follicularis]|uniref:DUF4283 domain-containing protein/zf-CCHC_4 domain-containing protein n=1 Tax=Cephalotus follicularis TaxID=3775 RepID=A0A1Q3BJG7_CEPFO|nr:DUF4283 domain-containing protein/zf-CCHC_4 domain-containing protein [Cephalotus follicularis]
MENKIWVEDSGRGKQFIYVYVQHEEDRTKVLHLGPWCFDRHVLLEKVKEEIHPSKISLSKVVFWIRVYGLPFLCLSEKVGKIVGNSIGEVEDIEVVMGRRENNQYIRVRVGIDARQPLRRGIKFHIGNSDNIWLSFQYEKLPNFCHACGNLGHIMNDCKTMNKGQEEWKEEDFQYGPWLRANNLCFGNYSP